MALYNDKVMDHFMNPRNVGEIENPDGSGTYGSPVCGDMMMITIKVDNDVITDAKFKTFGCGSAIASSSMATEMIIGKTIDEALAITNKDIVDELGGEKIDIVKYSDDPVAFISESLSPAKVVSVEVDPDGAKACHVSVPDAQLSLAIGNKGQNARLAAKLTGWKIDIRPESGFYGEE